MKRSLIFRYLSIALVAGVWSCSPKQIATNNSKEVYDDLYAQVGEANTSNEVQARSTEAGLNDNPENEKGRAYSNTEGKNEYYAEDNLDSRDIQRNATDQPGLGGGTAYDYTDGYRDGIMDSQRYAWGNNWNNGFNNFNRFGYNSFNNWYNPGVTIVLGGRNRFRNSWFNSGYNNSFYDFYSPFAYGNGFGYGSPFGYGNSFGYGGFNDPFYNPYNSFYNGYYGGGNGFYSAPRYYSNNAYNNNSNLGADRANRNYGPRSNPRNVNGYNDQFVNTANKPRTSADQTARKAGTVYNDPTNAGAGTYGSGGGYTAKPRGGYGGNSTNNNGTRTQTDNNIRSTEGTTARPRGGYSGNTNTTNASPSNNRTSSTTQNNTENNTYYARPSRQSTNNEVRRSSGSSVGNSSNETPSYSRGSSDRSSNSSSNSNWGSSNSSSSNSGSSSGSSSRGGGGSSSGGSSSGSSGGRGPR